jgi:hypothetical protein
MPKNSYKSDSGGFRERKHQSGVYAGGALFVPTEDMWIAHKLAHPAIGVRPLARASLRDDGSTVSLGLLNRWRRDDKHPDWFEGWLLRGDPPPTGVTIARSAQVRACRLAWDWVRHCHAAGLSPQVYVRWIRLRLLPSFDWIKWLFGGPAPDGAFIVTEAARKLRREGSQGAICRGAKPEVDKSTLLKWKRSEVLREALEAITEAVAGNTPLRGVQGFDQLDPRTRAVMLRYAKSATVASICERARLSTSSHQSLCREARRLGVEVQLRQYLTCTGRYGRHTNGRAGPDPDNENFFVPTPEMLRFQKVAGAAMAEHKIWALRSLPGFDEWFWDWTMPRPKYGKRLAVPPAAESPASGHLAPDASKVRNGSNGSAPRKQRGGRHRTDAVQELYRFCYERLASGAKRSIIRREAADQFARRASPPKSDEAVTVYACRYAKREGKPWPLPRG